MSLRTAGLLFMALTLFWGSDASATSQSKRPVDHRRSITVSHRLVDLSLAGGTLKGPRGNLNMVVSLPQQGKPGTARWTNSGGSSKLFRRQMIKIEGFLNPQSAKVFPMGFRGEGSYAKLIKEGRVARVTLEGIKFQTIDTGHGLYMSMREGNARISAFVTPAGNGDQAQVRWRVKEQGMPTFEITKTLDLSKPPAKDLSK